jgi:MFS transporter, ACS family, hexuronate transporter
MKEKASAASATRYRWFALVLAILAQLSASLALQAVAPLVPLLQADLGLSKTEVGLLASATSIGSWAVVLMAGLLTDRYGIRKVMSTALMATGALLMSLALVGSLFQALVVMFVAGLARGPVFPSSTKIVLEWFPPRSRGTAMGIKQMGMPLAGILAASTLPAVGLAFGWRSAFVLAGLFVLGGGILAALFYRNAPSDSQTSMTVPQMLAAVRELVGNRDLLVLAAAGFCFLTVQLAMLTYLAVYFAEVVLAAQIPDIAARIVAAGMLLAVGQVGGASGRVFWGVVSDRLFGGRRAVVLALVGTFAAGMALVFASLGSQLPMSVLALIAFLYGATAVGWNGVYSARAAEAVGRKHAGTGLGLIMTLTEGGTVLGPPMFGLMVDSTGAFGPAWLVLGCISAAGALFAMGSARRERHGRT